jgi:tetratricopeptide (TPR) repeat protein
MGEPSEAEEPESDDEDFDDADRLRDVGTMALKEGRFGDAAEAFDELLHLHGDDADTWLRYGQALLGCARLSDALHAVDNALVLDPSNVKALILKAQALGQAGDHDGAIALLQRVLDMEPGNLEASLALGLWEAGRSTERMVPAELPASPPPQSDANRGSVDRYAPALRWARERGLRALEATRRAPVGADWGEILLPAARQLLDALSSVAESDELWQTLQDRTAQLQARDIRRMQAVLGQDLAALLAYMGYRPPPPPQLLELELKDALADALEARGDGDVPLGVVRRAQRHLALFTFRLRRVIADAEEIRLSDEVPGGPDESPDIRWRRLQAAVEKGAKVAVPAALATGLITLVFPPAAPAAAAAGFTAAATAVGQELLKQGTQLAATGLLEKMTADEPALATADEQRTIARRRARIAVQDLRSVLVTTAGEPERAQVVDVYAVESISALYGLLEGEARCRSGSRQALPAAVDRAQDAVNRIRDVIRTSSSRHKWLELANRLLDVEQELAALDF